jgi:hypothetical protein
MTMGLRGRGEDAIALPASQPGCTENKGVMPNLQGELEKRPWTAEIECMGRFYLLPVVDIFSKLPARDVSYSTNNEFLTYEHAHPIPHLSPR